MDNFYLPILVLVSCIIQGNVANTSSPIVQTNLGSIQGRYHISRNGLQYPVFLGIKYATVPRRFDISEPVGPWDGIKDATHFGIHCAQKSFSPQSPVIGEEDCLSLNIFTPNADNGKRAVLFYVHGGGFNLGSGAEYNGGFLVDEDIVLVTMNYRLGILGFLSSGDDLVTGNMGLKDLLLALQWVNRHIEAFGGDPKRVTLGGNSAGSASVQFLMIYPAAQGLFSGVYGSSGSVMSKWAFQKEPVDVMREVAENLNCNMENNVVLIECLREEPLKKLLLVKNSLDTLVIPFNMKPTIEIQSSRNPNPVMVKHQRDIIFEGNFPKVPVLLTMTRDEGIIIYGMLNLQNENLRNQLITNFSHVAPIAFYYEDSVLEFSKEEMTKRILDVYFNGDITKDQNVDIGIINAYTDVIFCNGINELAIALGSVTSVYTGLFTHMRKDYSAADLFGLDRSKWEVVSHCDDLSYIFDSSGETDKVPWPHLGELRTAHDIDFSRKYTKMLASFLSTGVPTMPFGAKPTWSPVTTQEIESNALNWMELDNRDDVSLLINPFADRVQLWEGVTKQYKNKEEL